ncbi:hypothetical protein [Modestobacter sp. I12A-02662]|uniref:hypothetical protein n=1 Tax=Modestobacter sp. I12A-02662 TaxID=1730496 RepID=UPI0034DE7635
MTASPADPAKAAAEARTAALAAARAGLPQATSKPLEGTVDVGEGTGYLAHWIARAALVEVAETVAAAIRADVGAARVLLVEDRSLATRDWPLGQVLADLARHERVLGQQLDVLSALIGALRERPAVPEDRVDLLELDRFLAVRGDVAVPLTERVATHAASAADLLGLLRSDYAVTSASTGTPSSVLTAAVAAALLAKEGGDVLVEGFHLVPATGPVHLALDRALRADLDLTRAQAGLQSLLDRHPDNDQDERVQRARERDEETTALREAWTRTLAGLMTAPEGGVAPLAAAAVQAAVRGEHRVGTHVVHLSLDSSGTDVVSRRSLFGPSGRLWLVGGVTVSWLLLGPEGTSLEKAGSAHHGRRTEYDLATGAFAGAAIGDGDHGATAPAVRRSRFSATSPERTPRLIAIGLALAGGFWLVADALSKF